MPSTLDHATLGGGCFWCLEAVFPELRGVISVQSGYAGGHVADPTYEEVCAGQTGHAEVVRIAFDPAQVAYADLLKVFFAIHDPTTPNRQGADVGPQYRSVIFAERPEQAETAKRLIAEFERAGLFDAKIVTEVEPLEAFYPAEEVHHAYFARHPDQPYCRAVIAPKVTKFRKIFVDSLKR